MAHTWIALLLFPLHCIAVTNNVEHFLSLQTGTTVRLTLDVKQNVTRSPTWTVNIITKDATVTYNHLNTGPCTMSNNTVTIMNVTTGVYYVLMDDGRTSYNIFDITTYGK